MQHHKIRTVVSVIVIGGILCTGLLSLNSQYHFLPFNISGSSVPSSESNTEPDVITLDPQEYGYQPSLDQASSQLSSPSSKEQTPDSGKSEKVITENFSFQVNHVEVLKEVTEDIAAASDMESEKFQGTLLIPGYSFVLIDMTVKNEGAYAQTKTLNSIMLIGFDENDERAAQSEMCYFDKGDSSSRSYFHFTLQPHEDMNCKVGYVVEDAEFRPWNSQLVVNLLGRYRYDDSVRFIPVELFGG